MDNQISIRPSRDLRTNYAEISGLSKQHPVAITLNGREDTVIMSHEQYNAMQAEIGTLKARLQAYSVLAAAADEVKAGKTYEVDEVFENIVSALGKREK
jgi:PHD/YefM family antitoxin component YafN of YafNO toxin-antitoxin module